MSILGKTRYSNLDHLKQNIQVFSLGHKSFTYVRTPALLESYDQNRTFTARKLYDQTKRPSFDDKPSYTLLTYTHDMPDCQCAVKHNNGLQGRQTRQQNEHVYNSFPLPDMGYKEDILFYLSIDPFIQY